MSRTSLITGMIGALLAAASPLGVSTAAAQVATDTPAKSEAGIAYLVPAGWTATVEGTGWHGERSCAGQLTTGEGFAATADFAVVAVMRALADNLSPGALTPSMAFGPDWLEGLAKITLSPATI